MDHEGLRRAAWGLDSERVIGAANQLDSEDATGLRGPVLRGLTQLPVVEQPRLRVVRSDADLLGRAVEDRAAAGDRDGERDEDHERFT
jgi:hypothetical protein